MSSHPNLGARSLTAAGPHIHSAWEFVEHIEVYAQQLLSLV